MAAFDPNQPIIKKIKKVHGHGHHGGSWKIAYADFVTAMMAFFLLMWLLNATSEEQKRGIANYFDPMAIGKRNGGNVGVMGGLAIQTNEGSMDVTNSFIQVKPTPPMEQGAGGHDNGVIKNNEQEKIKDSSGFEKAPSQEEIIAQAEINSKLIPTQQFKNHVEEEKAFREIKERLKEEIQKSPELKAMLDNLVIDETPEGLRIQLIDQAKTVMFPSGSSRMYKHTYALLKQVANAIKEIPNKLAISGHTDATPYPPDTIFGNWELSTERANASRRVLRDEGIDEGRFETVVGKADRDLYDKDHPRSPQNRRISIVLLRASTKA